MAKNRRVFITQMEILNKWNESQNETSQKKFE